MISCMYTQTPQTVKGKSLKEIDCRALIMPEKLRDEATNVARNG